MAWFRPAKNKYSYETEVIENVVIHVFGSILNISVPGTTNLGSLPLSIPFSFPRRVVLMHSKWPPLSRKHVRSIAIWQSAPQSVVTIKASWGKEPLQINFTLFHHPWTPSECRTVLGDGCRDNLVLVFVALWLRSGLLERRGGRPMFWLGGSLPELCNVDSPRTSANTDTNNHPVRPTASTGLMTCCMQTGTSPRYTGNK